MTIKRLVIILMKNKAAFLDRDGVINHDYGYVHKKEDFVFKNGVIEALRTLNKLDYLIIIVTNQAGIAKKKFTYDDYNNLTNWYLNFLKDKEIMVADVLFCPHHKDALDSEYKKDCFYRKPNPGMFLKAIKKHNIDVEKSFTVGDKLSDFDASIKANVKNFFLVGSSVKNKNNIIQREDLIDIVNDYIL